MGRKYVIWTARRKMAMMKVRAIAIVSFRFRRDNDIRQVIWPIDIVLNGDDEPGNYIKDDVG